MDLLPMEAPGARRAGTGEAASGPGSVGVDLAAVLDHLPDGVVAAGADGRIRFCNDVVASLAGEEPGGLVGEPVSRLVPPRLRRAHLDGFGAFVATGTGEHVGGSPLRVPLLRADGTEVEVELRLAAVPSAEPDDMLVVASIRDASLARALEHQVVVDRHLRASIDVASGVSDAPDVAGAFRQVLPSLCEGLDWDLASLWVRTPAGTALRCVDTWPARAGDAATYGRACRSVEIPMGRVLPGLCWLEAAPIATSIEDDPELLLRYDAIHDLGVRTAVNFPLVGADGVAGVVELLSRATVAVDDDLLSLLADLGARIGQALDRIEAEGTVGRAAVAGGRGTAGSGDEADVDSEARVVEALRQAQRNQAFLLRASFVVASTDGYEATLDRLAAVAVPALADVCLIDVRGDEGGIVRMAARHADPALQVVLDEIRRHYPPSALSGHPSAQAVRSGRTVWSNDMSPEFLRSTCRDEHHFHLVSALGFRAHITVPLVSDGDVFGAITLVSCREQRRFGPDDVALAEELAARVARVVAKARRHDRERALSHTLQSTLISTPPARLGELAVAVRYLAGTSHAEVGGDFYDVFEAGAGTWVVTVGDVVGHDMLAASVMGRLRCAMRALAVDCAGPVALIDRLQAVWPTLGLERFATVALAWVDPATAAVRVAYAGHPPAVLVGAGGASLLEARPSPILGVRDGRQAEEVRCTIAPGGSLLLYTDGLVEDRHRPIDEGLRRLVGAAASAPADPERLCDSVLRSLVNDAPRSDDLAVLALARPSVPEAA